MVTHNWPAEKTKPERYQWKKPEWNKGESIRQKEQARIFIYRIGLRQNASTEQARIFYMRKKWCFLPKSFRFILVSQSSTYFLKNLAISIIGIVKLVYAVYAESESICWVTGRGTRRLLATKVDQLVQVQVAVHKMTRRIVGEIRCYV